MKYLLILSIVISVVLSAGESCDFDYQCGSMPYSSCMKRFQPLPGIGRDSSGNLVLLGTYNNTNSYFRYIGSLSPNGGSVSPQYAVAIDVPSGSSYTQTRSLYTTVPSLNLPYIVAGKTGIPWLGPYYSQTLKQNNVWAMIRVIIGVSFDDVNKRTFFCDGSVRRANKIIQTADDRSQAVELYKEQNCNFLGVNSRDELYLALITFNMNGTVTEVYKGNANCVGCSASSLNKVASLNFRATGLTVTNNHLFFSAEPDYNTQEGGLIQVPLSGSPSQFRHIVSEPVSNFVLDATNDWAYYQTSDSTKIKKVGPLSANHPQTTVLYDSNAAPSQGNCGCVNGFSGSNCNQCSGQVQWNNGQPQCIPLLPNGNPYSCIFDYNCNNPPFTKCQYNSCQCQSGFTGDRCQTCAGSIEWNLGIPTCKLN